MKATNATTYRSMLGFLNTTTSRLQTLQVAVATGRKLNTASDNPAGVAPTLLTRSRMSAATTHYDLNLAALDRLKAQDTQMDQAENLISRAIELTVASGNGTYGDYEREIMASEMKDLRDSMKSLANGQMDGKYFFSGFNDLTPPFVDNPAYDPILDPRPVLYQGDYGQKNLEISPGETETINFTGNSIFLGDADNDGVTDAGQVDIFAVMATIEEAMRNDDSAGATAALGDLNTALEQISVNRSQMGVAANRIDRANENIQDVKVDLEEVLSRYQDADLIESITEMTQQEQALQAAMDVTGRLSKLSILDYLR
ncbi:MAG: flagellar hook-associated protein 3 [Desulfuromonadaceae bacterium GWC2_58_13]|nr:MAG: flagellar hook-associated protein 3 [Desulfuromonadaceae bacterium GWC2_58_13]